MSPEAFYRTYSEDEILRIANSYHPVGSYRLLCSTFGEKPTVEECVEWLRDYDSAKAKRFDCALSILGQAERQVVEHRFGLFDARALEDTLESIAAVFSLPPGRILELECEALRRLRLPLAIRELAQIAPKSWRECFEK